MRALARPKEIEQLLHVHGVDLVNAEPGESYTQRMELPPNWSERQGEHPMGTPGTGTTGHRGIWVCAILTILVTACGPEEPAENSRPTVNQAPPAPTTEHSGPDIEAMIELLESESTILRCASAVNLGNHGTASIPAIPALARALGDSESTVSGAAGHALGTLLAEGAAAALAPLIRGLEDPRRVTAAVRGLGVAGIPAKSAVPRLVEMLQSGGDEDARCLLAKTLGEIGDGAASGALAGGLTDPSRKLRAECAWALAKVEPVEEGDLELLGTACEDSSADVAAGASFALWRHGFAVEPAIAVLSRILEDEGSAEARARALWALAEIGPAAASSVELVLSCLGSPDWKIRAYATFALGRLGVASEAVLKALVAALDNPDEDTLLSHGAAIALGELGPKAAPAAADLARHLDWPHAVLVQNALEKIGVEALPELEAMLAEEGLSAVVRERLRETVSRMRGE